MDIFSRLWRRLLFWRLMRQSRFIEALAVSDPEDRTLQSERRYAFYRLGCYRYVLEGPKAPSTSREAVALAVCNAACGDRDYARHILNPRNRLKGVAGMLLVEAVRGIAPYDLDFALELSKELEDQVLLRAALLAAAGEFDGAKPILEQLIAINPSNNPEAHLFYANLQNDDKAKLIALNRFLLTKNLTELTLAEHLSTLAVPNLRGIVEAGTKRGPLVTIAVPAYQTAQRIRPSIHSLLAQTYRDLEVIVVDDASDDGTYEVAMEIAREDTRVRVIRLPENKGAYAARNVALDNANGTFFTVQDSDDFAHPEKIERQVAPLVVNSSILFTLSDWVRVSDTGEFYARPIYPLSRLNPASPMFRREPVLDQIGYWDEVRTGADSAYTARLRLHAGRRGLRRLRMPLTIGAHREGSLMTDSETGIARGNVNSLRLDYWEHWTSKLIREVRK